MVIWLTGLPAAGKSTIARELSRYITSLGYHVEVMDGDEVRATLSEDLGYSRWDRSEHSRRVAQVARLLSKHQVIVICAMISPYEEDRQKARRIVGDGFTEIHVSCGRETCMKRDPKGLWKEAREGRIKDFTGWNAPYEVPKFPDLVVDTEKEAIWDIVERILTHVGIVIKEKGPDLSVRAPPMTRALLLF